MMPSSIPNPALRIGMMIGLGCESFRPVVWVTGVSISTLVVLTSLVASYARRVTSSSTSCLKTGEGVFLSLRTVNL